MILITTIKTQVILNLWNYSAYVKEAEEYKEQIKIRKTGKNISFPSMSTKCLLNSSDVTKQNRSNVELLWRLNKRLSHSQQKSADWLEIGLTKLPQHHMPSITSGDDPRKQKKTMNAQMIKILDCLWLNICRLLKNCVKASQQHTLSTKVERFLLGIK